MMQGNMPVGKVVFDKDDERSLRTTSFKIPRVLKRRDGPGRPANNIKPKFTPEQMEIAIQVAMYCKSVYNWVLSEADFVGLDINTPQGKEFFKKNAREAAIKLLK